MNRFGLVIAATATIAALGTGALVLTPLVPAAAETTMALPSTAAEHTAEAVKFDKEAQELNAKADHHTRLAAQYKARSSGGSKQEAGMRSLAQHCERLANAYRAAALEAREMAKSHREMAAAL